MTRYEYKVVPAPRRGERVRGVKAGEDRFAIALTNVMNTQAAAGWEYLRTETLPSEEREGLMGKTTVFQNMMVFRRLNAPAADAATPPTPLIEDRRDDDAASAPQTPVAASLHPVFRTPPLTATTAEAEAPAPVQAPAVTTDAPADVPGPVVTEDDRR